MSRESRMTAGILLPTALFLSVLSPDVLPLKVREEACRVIRQEAWEAPRLLLHAAQTGS